MIRMINKDIFSFYKYIPCTIFITNKVVYIYKLTSTMFAEKSLKVNVFRKGYNEKERYPFLFLTLARVT